MARPIADQFPMPGSWPSPSIPYEGPQVAKALKDQISKSQSRVSEKNRNIPALRSGTQQRTTKSHSEHRQMYEARFARNQISSNPRNSRSIPPTISVLRTNSDAHRRLSPASSIESIQSHTTFRSYGSSCRSSVSSFVYVKDFPTKNNPAPEWQWHFVAEDGADNWEPLQDPDEYLDYTPGSQDGKAKASAWKNIKSVGLLKCVLPCP
jgi:hypothetical protein